jgi:hypothetical protein
VTLPSRCGQTVAMAGSYRILITLILFIVTAAPLRAEDPPLAKPTEAGELITVWPLIDYRDSPKEGFSNLSILGPLFKWQKTSEQQDLALRPLFYTVSDARSDSAATDYLYPLATSESTPNVTRFQALQFYQKNVFRKEEEKKQERDFMLFPFLITGTSRKHGPYTSLFPIYGDIYDRFWRDEYHYVLFPLYGRTVKNGTTNWNVLYPVFSVTAGENETGFQMWPLYGQAAKEGVYRKRFALWPLFMQEEKGLDTANPVSKLYLLPLYAASDSATASSRSYLWPFFGHSLDRAAKEESWDLLWPLWRFVRGEQRNTTFVLPFYGHEQNRDDGKTWYLWPLWKREQLRSPSYRQDKDRLLYFLFSDNVETWPTDSAQQRRTALWPLFVYNRSTKGVKSVSFPAPVEPILNKDGIEKNWAPFWRLYQQRWNDRGDSAASLLWNLYWHEKRGADIAYELFPLLRYRAESRLNEVQILKGLVNYRKQADRHQLRLLWLPFGFNWVETTAASAAVPVTPGSRP